ncbi:hypothetical protein [Nonomuraea sp. SYSU D8015]|uniref:hypothetical protein n=1 Tax=Nonomuraea sp. SYSU D8015 TaxID=2593644 RepID=UPI001660CB9B|nr:hypothetical protein [Nonomuraea sp. SYSU D8015]
MNTATTDIAATRTGWRAWMSWIRPWYIGAVIGGDIEGHIYPDCERLLRIESEPREGAGWLDPAQGPVCDPCKARHNVGEERPA